MVARRRADRVITRAAVANKLRKIAVERSNAVSAIITPGRYEHRQVFIPRNV